MKIKKLNSHTYCLFCGTGLRNNERLDGHHLQYFPEPLIMFVHPDCHDQIHARKRYAGLEPIKQWIWYKKGDCEKYYALKKKQYKDPNDIYTRVALNKKLVNPVLTYGNRNSFGGDY